jgi:hypothetical protein
MSSPLDHLVYATPDLEAGMAHIENLLGVAARPGGNHPGMGTRNALLTLGTMCYLEIIGPDPQQTDFKGERPFGINALEAPRLVTWAARRLELGQFVETARSRGEELGEVLPMSRKTPKGELLTWELTLPAINNGVGIRPFFIDWGVTPHPAGHSPTGAHLKSLQLEHPQPEEVLHMTKALELEVSVIEAPCPGMAAFIECPAGKIELR